EPGPSRQWPRSQHIITCSDRGCRGDQLFHLFSKGGGLCIGSLGLFFDFALSLQLLSSQLIKHDTNNLINCLDSQDIIGNPSGSGI
uniref:Uncharacterized protein n=1 Tax=Romanomermis culicivorax TaxID=13658 RepID=A0A915IA11_ROMCU